MDHTASTTPESTPVGGERPPITMPAPIGSAALAGAAAAGLAFGFAELVSGLVESVPSAVSSVGTYVVDGAPPFVKDFAVNVFGTADKGALAIGTVILGLIIGALVGRAGLRRPWLLAVVFAGFAAVGIAAAVGQPGASVPLVVGAIGMAALAGWLFLRNILSALTNRDPSSHAAADPSRRRLMAGIAGAGVVAATSGAVGRRLIIARSESVRQTMGLAAPVSTVPPPAAAAAFDVPGITPIVVPNRDFYRIDTALLVPRPDPETWRLKVTGMVDRELSLSMSDLHNMENHERYVTIACVSNRIGGDLVGNAKWTGVMLTDVLEMAGVQEGATQIVPRSVDGWTAGFPTEVAFDGREAMIALGMNGEPLPPDHGFPARLIVPGLYGYVSATKWLAEIELTTWEAFDSYWVPRGWSKEGPIKTHSRIDTPRNGSQVTAETVVAGVAWAPGLGIAAVEVRVDEGDWMFAELSEPLSDTAWVQFQLPVRLQPGSRVIEVRATDGTGYTQTEQRTSVAPDGATGYHQVRVSVS